MFTQLFNFTDIYSQLLFVKIVTVDALKLEGMSAQSAQLSMNSFPKPTTLTESQETSEKTGKKRSISTSISASECCTKKPKRNYDKYKCVCLICANDEKIKSKATAILARGGNHLIERHRKRNHPKLAIVEVKEQIVAMDHQSVPKDVRQLKSIHGKAVTNDKRSNTTQSFTLVDDPESISIPGELLYIRFYMEKVLTTNQ